MITYNPPYKSNILSPTLQCRWGSNRMPYVFKFTRRDDEVNVTNAGGFMIFEVSGNTIITDDQGFDQGAVGSDVTIFFGERIVVGKITSITTIQPITFVTDIPYLASYPSTAEVNYSWLKNYKVVFEVLYANPLYVELEKITTLEATFDPKGEIELDIRTVLEHNMNKINDNPFNYNTNVVDEYKYLRFLARYKTKRIEGYQTSYIETNFSTDDVAFHAIDGAKRLKEKYGQNYAEYETNRSRKLQAKFLTRFTQPTYFDGYPFSLSYIFNTTMRNDDIDMIVREYTAAGTNVATITSNMNTNLESSVQQLTLHDSATQNLGTTYCEVWLQNNDIEVELPGDTQLITEKKIVKIKYPCNTTGIYLMWKNTLGGWDFWLFNNKYETSFTSKQGGTISVDPYDTEFALYREKVLEYDATKLLTVGDVVLKSDIDALAEIQFSPQVYMLTHPDFLKTTDARYAWTGVIVATSGVKYLSDSENILFEVKIQLPDFYTVAN